MPRALKSRFAFMMLLEYVVPGAYLPILSLYLKDHLHFQPHEVGKVLAMPALAAIVAPFVTSHIADRFISAERLLGLCHTLAGLVMISLAYQTRFPVFLGLFFVYGLLFTPTFGLTNTVVLHHVADARRDFGGIRMWGTVGWVIVAWTFGLLWLHGDGGSRLHHALILSALASFALGMYAFTLPRAQVHEDKPKTLAYWKAAKVFLQPGLVLLCIMTLINSMTHVFFYYGMSPFLRQAGFADNHIMPTMSIGQVSEVITLALLGGVLARLGTKRVLIIGALAQALRHLFFAFGTSTVPIVIGIGLHGLCYAFWFTAAYLYVDHHSTAKTRAGAQQLFTIIISGAGNGAGHILAGYTAQHFAAPETGLIDFRRFWLVPLVSGLFVTVVTALFFRANGPESSN